MNERQFDAYMMRWLERHAIKQDLTQEPNRDLRKRMGETKVLNIVIPCVTLNPDTGVLENLAGFNAAADIAFTGDNTHAGTETFNDDITLAQGKKMFTDTDKDTYLYSDADDSFIIMIGGSNRFQCTNSAIYLSNLVILNNALRVSNGIRFQELASAPASLANYGWVYVRNNGGITELVFMDDTGGIHVIPLFGRAQAWTARQTFDGEIKLGIGVKLYMDDDEDTYIVASSDDVFQWYAGGVKILEADASGNTFLKLCNHTGKGVINIGEARFDEIAKPSTVANHGQIYCRDVGGVAEMMVQDDGATETQLSAHDENGYYVHRSTIPSRGIELQIDIEQMFRDNSKLHKYITEVSI